MPIAIASATEAGNIVTITTTVLHGLSVNQNIIISGVAAAGYNGGIFIISSVPSPTSFTYSNATTGLLPSGGGLVLDANYHPFYVGDNSLPYSGIGRYHTTAAPYASFPGVDDILTFVELSVFLKTTPRVSD